MCLFFVIFRDRGVIKIDEKPCACFLWFFMTPGSWKLMKNGKPYFCDFSWPRGHENWWKMESLIFVIFRDRGVIKIDEKPSACFLWFFMTPGSWKLMKNRVPDFCDFSWPRGHKNWWKTMCLFFVIFHDPGCHENWWKKENLIFVIFGEPGVMKIDEKRKAFFLCIFMTAGSWKLMKNGKPYFCDFLWPRGHKNRWKTKCLFFVIFHDSGVMKIDEKWKALFLWFFVTAGS